VRWILKGGRGIYTCSDHQSVILYVQCGDTFPLFILEGSSEELVMGKIKSLGGMLVYSSGLERVSLRCFDYLL
jgi:hypothetical protein